MRKHLRFLALATLALALRTSLVAAALLAGYGALHAAVWAFGQEAGLPYGLGVCTGVTLLGFWPFLRLQSQLEAGSVRILIHASYQLR